MPGPRPHPSRPAGASAHRAGQRGIGFRIGWWLACLAVVALGGWGIGQLVVAAQAPGAPPALPSQILALPSGGLAHTTTGPGPLSRSIPRKIIIPTIGLRAGIEEIGMRPDGAIETPSFERPTTPRGIAQDPARVRRARARAEAAMLSPLRIGVLTYITGPLAAHAQRQLLGIRERADQMAREQLESTCCVGVCGVYNLTAEDHAGLADDALVVATSKAEKWTVVPPA